MKAALLLVSSFLVFISLCYFLMIDQRDSRDKTIVVLRDSVSQLKTYNHELQDSLKNERDYSFLSDTVFIFKGAVFAAKNIGWTSPIKKPL